MALRLRVVSEHATRLGEQSTKVFGVHGGTIGRSIDNEWILPDTERYLSGKHARVDFRAGTYVLVDTSSNGTYVNGAQVPLGKYHDYLLKDGDYIRLGEYELLVSIDKSNDFPPENSAIVAYDGQSPSSAVRKSTANDLGEDLDLSQLLEPSDLLAGDSGVRPRDAYGQAVPGRALLHTPEFLDPAVYAPFSQNDEAWRKFMTLLIRTRASEASLVEDVKKQVWSLDSQIPVSGIQSMDDLLAVSVAQQRFNMLLLGSFAALAVALAGVGIYGMVAYRVNQRTHEIGVYIALGAQHRHVLRLVMKDGVKLGLLGIVLGLAGAIALTRVMVSLLFEVNPTDPATLIGVALLLAAVAMLACYIPARRALSIDPMTALRRE